MHIPYRVPADYAVQGGTPGKGILIRSEPVKALFKLNRPEPSAVLKSMGHKHHILIQ